MIRESLLCRRRGNVNSDIEIVGVKLAMSKKHSHQPDFKKGKKTYGDHRKKKTKDTKRRTGEEKSRSVKWFHSFVTGLNGGLQWHQWWPKIL